MDDTTIESLYSRGNDANRGFSAGFSTKITPYEAAVEEELTDIRYWNSSTTQQVNVIGVNQGGHLIAIADIYGPWGVDITDEMEEQETA